MTLKSLEIWDWLLLVALFLLLGYCLSVLAWSRCDQGNETREPVPQGVFRLALVGGEHKVPWIIHPRETH